MHHFSYSTWKVYQVDRGHLYVKFMFLQLHSRVQGVRVTWTLKRKVVTLTGTTSNTVDFGWSPIFQSKCQLRALTTFWQLPSQCWWCFTQHCKTFTFLNNCKHFMFGRNNPVKHLLKLMWRAKLLSPFRSGVSPLTKLTANRLGQDQWAAGEKPCSEQPQAVQSTLGWVTYSKGLAARQQHRSPKWPLTPIRTALKEKRNIKLNGQRLSVFDFNKL